MSSAISCSASSVSRIAPIAAACRLRAHHEAREFRRAAAETRALWAAANAYLQETAPWAAIRTDPERAAVVTRAALGLLRVATIASWSIIPGLARVVLHILGEPRAPVPAWPEDVAAALLGRDLAGRRLLLTEPIVRKVVPEELTAFGAVEAPGREGNLAPSHS